MSYTIPPDDNAIGNAGHTTQHNNMADVLTGMGAVLNVQNTAYSGGADPTGVNDSTAAIQAAVNAGFSYLPAGTYKVSSTITISLAGSGLTGPRGRWYHGTAGGPVIQPTSSFSGSSIINITASEVELGNLTIDCSNVSGAANTDGLDMTGNITNGYVHDILIRNAPKYGFQAVYSSGSPFTSNFRKVIIDGGCTSAMWNIANMTDCMFDNCYAIGGAAQGWYIYGTGNTKMIGCRAEWSNVGYQVDGNSGFRDFQMVGCSTDRNTTHGLQFTCTGTDPITITGFTANRDGAGSTSGNYAGVSIASAVTNPIVLTGLSVTSGKNDDGTGNATPQFGVSFHSGTSPKFVSIVNGFINAITTAMDLSATTNFHTRCVYTSTGFPVPATFTNYNGGDIA